MSLYDFVGIDVVKESDATQSYFFTLLNSDLQAVWLHLLVFSFHVKIAFFATHFSTKLDC
ncbi:MULTISPECIES: hypothetical protein [Legionella]|uniref:Transposase n=1 Tax=Legionella resiliens TaxID=2905958 RepID=A0ABS8X140_9GAMM|nr:MULTISPECIES: hypothetical protein [unclassified Legionella]MCE0722365.1 hypothetical protein [Legionella sp. 9fVS26]MCE3531519.1 hypothetical protein [Legionella sp. 8cVS16]QLZ67538.1 hypothetical protein FOLKNPGA_00310 [Legionella sp. PC1000]